MTTAPRDDILDVIPARPPARRVARDLIALLLIVVGFAVCFVFLWAVDPALTGAAAGLIVAVIGTALALER